MQQREFKDVQLEHVLADAGGMQLVRNPKQFDVIVTDNLFGDMLSDVAAMLTGSLGMLAVGLARRGDPKTKKRKALYEPVHGSAPDIAGKGVANPIAMIASFAMALRYSFGMVQGGRHDRAGDCGGARARACAPPISRRRERRRSAPPRWAMRSLARWRSWRRRPARRLRGGPINTAGTD